ncbi:MAG: tRNA pseudouridine(13) synthase TruD [Thermoplasmatota archaeon]
MDEATIGLATFLTDTPGCQGRLRCEIPDFRVIELGDGPKRTEGKFSAARIELTNWETNRFVQKATQRLKLKRGQVAFAGMKDKRAISEQWFSFKCKPERVQELETLEDVRILDGPFATPRAWYAGAHTGNRFVLRVREHNGQLDGLQDIKDAINAHGGVPNFFGPQRFGSGVRPVTHLMGEAIVKGDLEEAVRLYVGNPVEGEREDAFAARQIYEETRDPEATLEAMPVKLDFERSILERLVKQPGEWRYALMALPRNLINLFIHAHQSFLFNHTISARLQAGLGLNTAHIGDRVMAMEEDGSKTTLVTPANQARVQREIDAGRATLTAPLLGMHTEMADGTPGEIERSIVDKYGVKADLFACREMPSVASQGLRRGILQRVDDLDVQIVDGDPVIAFGLGRGAYATVVMREFMKAPILNY